MLQGNGNLNHTGAARVILNEVTGASRSRLLGATEVFGKAADLVIANPNGLTCDGCGFINTPRVTLSTGTADLGMDGALTGLTVSRGDVTIGQHGAGLGQSDLFEVISRRISVNGPVNTHGRLSLIAGHNSYALKDGRVTALGTDGDEPGIAIDSSALGGMYAGRIRLVANDQGAGVNMQGDMAANAGDMTLFADGKLALGKAHSKGRLSATSRSQSVEVGSTLFSDDAVELNGKASIGLADNALVGATGDVTLTGGEVSLGKAAFVASGLKSDGTQASSGILSVKAETLSAGNGEFSGGGLLSITAGSIDISRASGTGPDALRSLGAIVISAEAIDATNGKVTAKGDLKISAVDALSIKGGQFLAGGSLLASAANLSSSASLAAVNQAKLIATDGAIVQSGTLQGTKSTTLSASGKIENDGRILSPGTLAIAAGSEFSNSATGVIAADDGLDIQAGKVSNEGAIAAQGGNLAISSLGDLANAGKLTGLAGATLTAQGSANNSGILHVKDELSLSAAGDLLNSGTINAGSAAVKAASLDNQGLLTSHAVLSP